MENIYTAYTKQVNDQKYYFVKKFVAYPELKGVPHILETYGMHTDFEKACRIANITNAKIKEQLLLSIEENIQHAKIIELNPALNNKIKTN